MKYQQYFSYTTTATSSI